MDGNEGNEKFVGHLLSQAGLGHQEESTKELSPARVVRDNKDLDKIIQGFETTLNPFAEGSQDNNLYRITTGRAVSEAVKEDLLNCQNRGHAWCEEFTEGSFFDQSWLEKPIPRWKIRMKWHY